MSIFILIERHLTQDEPETISSVEWYEIDISKEELKNHSFDEYGCSKIKIHKDGPGYNFLVKSDVILEIKEGKDWDSFWTMKNRSKTSGFKELVKNSTKKELKIGWLSPEGKMHYCEYQDHIAYVHEVLDLTVPTIEKRGWLHIRKYPSGKSFYNSDHRITQAQAKTLREELDVHVFDDDILY